MVTVNKHEQEVKQEFKSKNCGFYLSMVDQLHVILKKYPITLLFSDDFVMISGKFSGLLFRFINLTEEPEPRKGNKFLTTSNGKSLDKQVVTIDLQKKNKHSINISPEITTSSPQKPTLITLRSNPLNLLTTPLLQFFPSA